MPEVGPLPSVDTEPGPSSKPRAVGPRLGALAGLVLAALAVAACATAPGQGGLPGFFPPASASEGGGFVDRLYPVIFWIAVAVFFLVEGLLIWIVLRYRQRPTDDALPTQTHGHNVLEIIWTAIPALIVTGLFVMTVDTLAHIEHVDAQPQGVVVDVTGFQWQWTFDYANEDLSFTGAGAQGPTMAVPVGERVRLRLHSQDVIHSFYVPSFRYKKDVVPGRTNEFEMVVEQPGTYTGQCAEFCGLSHYEMFFTVQAMSRADYDAWVIARQQEASQSPSPPPDNGFRVVLNAIDVNTFDPESLAVPADVPIVFGFHNLDTAAQHNVAIEGANADGSDWIGLPITPAGQSASYTAPALPAGTYTFYCAVHPTTMRGTLTVGP
ncbi:MAG TPA: cytochrome c oxidase subunit II [Candidatus Limnocylindrales bacterium]